MNVELKETIYLMISPNYKDRFIAEYCQLAIRYIKLSEMLSKWDNGELDFVPTCPRSTYELQIDAMRKYMAVLEARARMEGIDLSATPTKEESVDEQMTMDEVAQEIHCNSKCDGTCGMPASDAVGEVIVDDVKEEKED